MRAPSDLEPRAKARFSRSQKDAILLRQSFEDAQGHRIAQCADCVKHIARLNADGKWEKLCPFEFDHDIARGLYGPTTEKNGKARDSGPGSCHARKTAIDVAMMTKADAQGARTGQSARRKARKARGERPLLQGRGFQKW